MQLQLRQQQLIYLYPVVFVLMLAIYGLSLISLGLAVAFAFAALALICIQMIAKAQRLNVRAQDNLFHQSECLRQLNAMIKPPIPLPATRGYAAAPDFLLHLYKRILNEKPKVIVEASSGVSTLVAAYAAKTIGNCQVVSLEHDESYSEVSRATLVEHGLTDVARIVHTPIVSHAISGQNWLWYDFKLAQLPQSIDLLVIDGPPRRIQKFARFPALPLLYDHLSDGAHLYLDDSSRKDEQGVIKKWRELYPSMGYTFFANDSGLCIMTNKSG